METALTILAIGIICLLCFVTGAKVGQTVSTGKTVELPNLNPVAAYQEAKEKKEADKEQEWLDAVMRNIERYDGTSVGQEEIRKG